MDRKKLISRLGWGLCFLCLLMVIVPTVDIVVDIIARSGKSWTWSLLFTPTQGIAGGLFNAWTGTLALMALLLIMIGPLGILGGLYLAEFGGKRMTGVLRFCSEVLAGVPSIVIGYVSYAVLVVALGWSFSMLAGAIALSIMVIPYVLKSTETALRQVPTTLREGGASLGLPPNLIIRKVLFPIAIPNIISGLVISEAIAMGETAPLIYTAGWSNSLPNLQLIHRPIGYLTYVVWTYINEPYPAAHQLAYSAAALLLLFLLVLIGIGRLISWRAARFTNRYQA